MPTPPLLQRQLASRIKATRGVLLSFIRVHTKDNFGIKSGYFILAFLISALSLWQILSSQEFVLIKQSRSCVFYLILFCGSFISLLLGLFIQTSAFARNNEKKHAEKEQLFTTRLNVALKSAQIGVWSVDIRTKEVWRSQNHDEIFGYTERLDFWDSHTFFKHIFPEDLIRVKEEHRRAMSQADVSSVEFRIIRADNQSVRWIKTMSRLLLDNKGTPIQMIGIIRDITLERSEEAERLAALEWRKAILGATTYSIISTDENGIIQTFNPAAERMLGYPASEVIGKKTPAIFHDETETIAQATSLSRELNQNIEPGFETYIAKVKTLGISDENEWIYIRKDGSRIPVSLSVTVLKNPLGKITGYLGVSIDLTERKKERELLSAAHERLQRLIDATGEGIWERDFYSKEVRFIDLQCKKIFGFSAEDQPTYEQLAELIHPEDRQRLQYEVERHISEKTPRFEVTYRVLNRKKSGTQAWVRTKGKVTEVNGRLDRLVSTISDVTHEVEDKNRLEEALVKAEAATIAKSTFLASMSHEIRTPLNGIIGMTELMNETQLDLEQKKYMGVIQQSGTSLLALINDILDFSKIEAGKLELENTPFSLAAIVETQADILISKAQEKGISLVTFISPELPVNLTGDPGRIGQILLNLMGNAVKFTATGGVAVRVFPVKESQPKSNSLCVRFEVEDTGIGLSTTSKTRLFQPFIQADSAISNKYGGTGLGLSISKRLVEAMDGQIGVTSTAGKGSTFWFEILLMCSETERGPEYNELHHVRALIVDEDFIIQDTLHRYISSWGMRASRASSITEATQAIKESQELNDPYQIAIFSKNLGLLFGKKMDLSTTQNTPKIILLNEFRKSLDPTESQSFQIHETLNKPIKQSQLFDAISNCLSKTSLPSASILIRPEKIEARGSSGLRILIADDVAANQMLTLKLLERLGYNAIATANGSEVLAALKLVNYDLILMDCQMPEMDGFEATRRIRLQEKATGQHIPIIALTANAMSGDDKKCLAAGMDDYLSKPIRKETLNKMLNKWLSSYTDEKHKKSA